MKLNTSYSLLALALIAMSSTANAAATTEVNAGTINFEGKVVEAPCLVDLNDVTQRVDLPEVPTRQFYDADNATATLNRLARHSASFTLGVTDCPSNAVQEITFKFKGEADASNSRVLKNAARDGSGVGIAILEEDATTIIPVNSGTSSTMTIASGATKGEKTFYADYISTGSVITIGDVTATATFDVTFN